MITALISIYTAGTPALVLFVPALAAAPREAAEEVSSPEAHSAKSVPTEVRNEVARRAAEKPSQIVDDAVATLRESVSALTALGENRMEAALQSLARAVGKLESVIAREPKLALAPVDVDLVLYDLFATTETAEEAVERAGSFLEDGMLEDTPDLVSDLAPLLEALGYGPGDVFSKLYSELEQIETKTAPAESGEWLFDDLREALSRAFS